MWEDKENMRMTWCLRGCEDSYSSLILNIEAIFSSETFISHTRLRGIMAQNTIMLKTYIYIHLLLFDSNNLRLCGK
jgi:hypothetical protein